MSLYSEEQSGSGGSRSSMVPLESHSLDNGGVPFFFFTTLTRDEKWYTLRLESTLSRSVHFGSVTAQPIIVNDLMFVIYDIIKDFNVCENC